MSLSCSCDFDYDDDPEWYWWQPKEYSTYKKWRSQKCCCKRCENRVSYNDTVGEVTRSRQHTEWELDHMGEWGCEGDPEAVWLASAYMCERCTDLFFSFDDLGFECVSPYEDMLFLASEYHEVYQTKEKRV